MTNQPFIGLHHVALRAPDLEQAVTFFRPSVTKRSTIGICPSIKSTPPS